MGFHEFENQHYFRKIPKIMKMVKSALFSNPEKIAFTRFGVKPAGEEVVLDLDLHRKVFYNLFF
jgi:hypothetical protein